MHATRVTRWMFVVSWLLSLKKTDSPGAVKQAMTFRLQRSSQRRISGLLSALLCLWLLASAAHFHAPDQYAHSHQSVHSVCGFCAGLSTAGAASSTVIFRAAVQPQEYCAAADDAQVFARLVPAAYRSRAPPAA